MTDPTLAAPSGTQPDRPLPPAVQAAAASLLQTHPRLAYVLAAVPLLSLLGGWAGSGIKTFGTSHLETTEAHAADIKQLRHTQDSAVAAVYDSVHSAQSRTERKLDCALFDLPRGCRTSLAPHD